MTSVSVSLRQLTLSTVALAALAGCDASPAATASSAVTPPAPAASIAASAPAASQAAKTPSSSPQSSSAASVQSAASGPASAAAGGVKLTIAANAGSEMNIKMRELLAGNVAQNDAIESTKTVSGIINLDPNGEVLPGSKISLDLRTLKSDRAQRDNFIKGRFVLDTAQYPTVDFVPTQVQGLGGTPPSLGEKTFKLTGNATVRGVTRPLTWDVTATFDQQGCQGQATTTFKLSDFGMSPPKAGPVVQVEDAGSLLMKFQATRAAP